MLMVLFVILGVWNMRQNKICVLGVLILSAICILNGCGPEVSDSTNGGNFVQIDKNAFSELENYYKENGHEKDGWYMDGMKSVTLEGAYLLGWDDTNSSLFCGYASDDKTTSVLINIYEDGKVNGRVVLKSYEEGVSGDFSLLASEYSYDDYITEFSYDSESTKWKYENFELRANDYIRKVFLYTDYQLKDLDMEISLTDIGFAQYEPISFADEKTITQDDIAGTWELVTETYGTRLFFIDDKVYGWNWNTSSNIIPEYSDISSDLEEYLIAEDVWVSDYDFIGGETIVTDISVDKDDDTFRRVIYYDDDVLCMRVESLYGGLGNPYDGKIFYKVKDAEKVQLTPVDRYAENTQDSAETEIVNDASDSENNKNESPYISSGERNAVEMAKLYIETAPFSRNGLVDQLKYEGFTEKEAEYGADNCGADWYDQAVKSALAYLELMSFSRQELISQLEYEGFTHDQAEYGVKKAY